MELPFVDEHTIEVDGGRDAAWRAVQAFARRLSAKPAPAGFRAVWAPDPASGFTVTEVRPGELVSLSGRHRFSRYRLDLLVDAGGRVRARTFADFPGPHGRAYRALVIGSGGHRVATRLMLRRIAGYAEATTSGTAASSG